MLVATSAAWLTHRACAYVGERARNFDAGLMRYTASTYFGVPRVVTVNGLKVAVDVGTTDDSVHEVLDFFHARCAHDRDQPVGNVIGMLHRVPSLSALWDRAVLRREDGSVGTVACFDSTATRVDLGTLASRLHAFSRELDASVFGTLVYVTAERDAGVTRYVVLRSAGRLPLSAAFPKARDAPGNDPPFAPRPAHSQRLLSASSDGTQAALHVFRSTDGDAATCLAAYQRALVAAGFTVGRTGERTDDHGLHANSQRGAVEVAALNDGPGASLLALISARETTGAESDR